MMILQRFGKSRIAHVWGAHRVDATGDTNCGGPGQYDLHRAGDVAAYPWIAQEAGYSRSYDLDVPWCLSRPAPRGAQILSGDSEVVVGGAASITAWVQGTRTRSLSAASKAC
jgi:hypothetical protein